MTMTKVIEDAIELRNIKDDIKEIMTGKEDSRDKDIRIIKLVHGYRRIWEKIAFIDGFCIGMAIGAMCVFAYHFLF